jgi:hypothetical protein
MPRSLQEMQFCLYAVVRTDGLSSANKSWNLCGFIRRGIPRHVFEQSVCQKRTNFCSMGTRESNQFWSRVEKSILRFHEISPWFCLWKKKWVKHRKYFLIKMTKTCYINISSHFICIWKGSQHTKCRPSKEFGEGPLKQEMKGQKDCLI